MRTATLRLEDLKTTIINMGYVGENEHKQIRFDGKKMFQEYPNASVSLTVCPACGEAYPATIERDGDFVLWTITDSDLVAEGCGEIQLTFTESPHIAKSYICRTKVLRSLVPTGDIPSGLDDFITRADALLDELEDAIPEGGTTGQVLAKKSNDDFDTEWVDQTGGGGTGDYDQLENRPQIGGVTLTGNKSLHDLGAATEEAVGAKYTKPSGGIPASDMASGVIPVLTDLIDDTAGDGVTDKTWSADRMSEMETLLEEILSSGDSWAGVQYLVRQGKGATAFPVGTQLRTRKETSMSAALGTHTGITAVSVNEETFLGHEGRIGNGIHEFHYDGAAWIYENQPVTLSDFGITVTGTAKNGDQVIVTEAFTEILWDVVEHKTVDGHPRMVLLMHNCWYNRPFDAIEALYYAEEGLAAGDYHFTIQNYDATYGGNKTYQFTLTEAVPAGGHILLDWPYNQQLLGRSVKTYASKTATTQIESAVLSEGIGGTDLGTTDGNSTNLNHIHRARYGSNNYKESAVRQWLNSAEAAGSWWSSQTKFDLKSGYAGEAGFLHGMDSDFLAVVAESTVKCVTNNTFELPGWTLNTAYTVQEKFYLPSRPEVGLGDDSMDQGSVWSFYDGAADTDRIKRDFVSTARIWWLRSPYPSYAFYVRIVDSSGALSGNYACGGTSAAAACEIG